MWCRNLLYSSRVILRKVCSWDFLHCDWGIVSRFNLHPLHTWDNLFWYWNHLN